MTKIKHRLDLTKLDTRLLLSMRQQTYLPDDWEDWGYDDAEGDNISIFNNNRYEYFTADELYTELNTREHVPSAPERKAIRQQKAKNQRSRGRR